MCMCMCVCGGVSEHQTQTGTDTDTGIQTQTHRHTLARSVEMHRVFKANHCPWRKGSTRGLSKQVAEGCVCPSGEEMLASLCVLRQCPQRH